MPISAQALVAAILADPKDVSRQLIYADWLREQKDPNDPLAYAWEWMARLKRWPCPTRHGSKRSTRCYWIALHSAASDDLEYMRKMLACDSAYLPHSVHKALPWAHCLSRAAWDVPEAVKALAAALARLQTSRALADTV